LSDKLENKGKRDEVDHFGRPARDCVERTAGWLGDRRDYALSSVASVPAILRERESEFGNKGVSTVKLLLDTDIGYDIDDAVCLAYLLAHPDAELLGITTVTGEANRRAMMASAQCKVAGKSIPIYPGAEQPLLVATIQAHAPQADALSRWPHETEFPVGQAVDFMRRTIRAHPGEITLLAIGPLTNIATLFSLDPEIPMLLKSLVLMNGQFIGENRVAEWNVQLDPHASAIVYKAPVPVLRSVGLDVTLQVAMGAAEVRRRFKTRLLLPVLDFAAVWFRERPEITFHDPLAAAVLFDDAICGFERGRVTVDLCDKPGRVTWAAGDGPHEIATRVDANRFFEHYFGIVTRA
jgi:inosine-uridine nucleoside N-ribohydrolase